MRKESQNWWRQALADLEAAKDNLTMGHYFVSAFLCQQAAEKALKVVFMETLRERPPHTHSLIEVGRRLSAPSPIQSALRRLTPAYVITRYPDAATGIPAELYDEGMARTHLDDAEEVFRWAKECLGLT